MLKRISVLAGLFLVLVTASGAEARHWHRHHRHHYYPRLMLNSFAATPVVYGDYYGLPLDYYAVRPFYRWHGHRRWHHRRW
jgi:hypothetical protein